MPDEGRRPETAPAGEEAADSADAGLLRGVRRNLVLWSGGTTLVVLLVLGAALYVTAANSLASSSQAQLESAMTPLRAIVSGERPDPGDASPYDFDFASGTFALVVDAADRPIGRPRFRLPDGLPAIDAIGAARSTGRDLRIAVLGTIPVRILSESVTDPRGDTYVIQVIQDRTAEQRTLDVMLVVLGVGGVAVLLVAFGFGTLYARRALVPIRTSLANQRLALRRQREFAADASHELRTPLTVIRSSVEHLARHRAQAVGDVGTALDDIDDEVRHMTSIVEDLLLLARSDSGAVALERLPVDLGDVAADAASALAKPAGDRGVAVQVDPQPSMVDGDPARLRQLVMILVDNAIRHSPAGGQVNVTVRDDGLGATVTVDDDGPGIRPEERARIFERFYRAPGAPGGGTGLGLAIAAWIVARHEGRIDVDDRPDGGARFTVRLPAASGQAVANVRPASETR